MPNTCTADSGRCATCGLRDVEHHERYVEYPVGAYWERLQRQLDPLSADGPPHSYVRKDCGAALPVLPRICIDCWRRYPKDCPDSECVFFRCERSHTATGAVT